MSFSSSVGFFFVGLILLMLSGIPCGYALATNVLQGLGTGLISGVLLLVIDGIKTKEKRNNNIKLKRMQSINIYIFKSLIVCEAIRKEGHITKSNHMKELTDYYLELDNIPFQIVEIETDDLANCVEKVIHSMKEYIEEEADIEVLIKLLADVHKKMIDEEIRIQNYIDEIDLQII